MSSSGQPSLRQHARLDSTLGADEGDLVSACAQLLRQRNPGEEVTSRPPARDDDVHETSTVTRRPAPGFLRFAVTARSDGRVPADKELRRAPGPAPREMSSRIPIAKRSTTSVDPPNETKGKGRPFVGSAPSTTPMFTIACRLNIAVSAEGQIAAERIARLERRPRAAPGDHDEDERDGEDAEEAELFTDDRHDVVGVRLGQEEQLLPAVAEAEAMDARPIRRR